jgi:protein-disulfide isomerase
MSRKPKRNRPVDAPAASPSNSRRTLWIAFGVAALVLGAIALLFMGSTGSGPTSGGGDARAAALASTNAPSEGPADAKVHIVEFLDPACETCAAFYPIAKQYMASNPGRIRLSVRHVGFHDGAEYAVRLLEASRKQGKYWETLERLLGTQSAWSPGHSAQPALVDRAVEGLGLDMAKLATDMSAPDVLANVRRDMADAVTLKVTQTPEYFVNGKGMPSFGEEQLRKLIRDALND